MLAKSTITAAAERRPKPRFDTNALLPSRAFASSSVSEDYSRIPVLGSLPSFVGKKTICGMTCRSWYDRRRRRDLITATCGAGQSANETAVIRWRLRCTGRVLRGSRYRLVPEHSGSSLLEGDISSRKGILTIYELVGVVA